MFIVPVAPVRHHHCGLDMRLADFPLFSRSNVMESSARIGAAQGNSYPSHQIDG